MDDRRSYRAHITSSGEALLDRLAPIADAVNMKAAKGLTAGSAGCSGSSSKNTSQYERVTMENLIRQSDRLAELLGLTYQPIAFMFSETKPPGALDSRRRAGDASARSSSLSKGKTVAFDELDGVPCSAFTWATGEWIFPGIEYFLSHGPVPGRSASAS